MKQDLTRKQEWMLNYLYSRICDGFISPTEIGKAYGTAMNHQAMSIHSSIASPTLLKLVEHKLIERNSRGHYKAV